jgi:sec-independent protein translocase protein TatA
MALLGIPGLGTGELVIILVIVLVLFGPKRLPQLGKSLGKTMKSLRDGIEGKDEDEEEEPVAAAEAEAPEKPKATEASEEKTTEE